MEILLLNKFQCLLNMFKENIQSLILQVAHLYYKEIYMSGAWEISKMC